jgi:hypothetical protein
LNVGAYADQEFLPRFPRGSTFIGKFKAFRDGNDIVIMFRAEELVREQQPGYRDGYFVMVFIERMLVLAVERASANA